jgi:hypothetical protein
VDGSLYPTPKTAKPTGWNVTHSGKGWNSFKKSSDHKSCSKLRKDLSPPKKHNFKVFKSEKTTKNPFGDVITTTVTIEGGGDEDENGDIDIDDEGNIIRGHKTKRFYRVNTEEKKDRGWKRYISEKEGAKKSDAEDLSYKKKKCVAEAEASLSKHKKTCH